MSSSKAKLRIPAPRRLVSSMAIVVLLAGVGMLATGCIVTVGTNPMSDCTATQGVIVAVDFSAFGKPADKGCDPTTTTGYAALQAAGYTTAGDQHDGNAFICRIDDEPPPSQDACIDTPPASAYWSYWHANSGQNTWTLSQLGAMSYQPKPGIIDAWAFGAGSPPTFTPAQVRG
jgi:hypothetical protein